MLSILGQRLLHPYRLFSLGLREQKSCETSYEIRFSSCFALRRFRQP